MFSWLRFIFVLAFIAPAYAGANDRLRVDLPKDDIRLNIIRFSPGAFASLRSGKITDHQFYPDTYSGIGLMGTVTCSGLLDRQQAFPLEGMLKAKYIDQSIFDALKDSSVYLHTEQVTFMNVHSMVSQATYQKIKNEIPDSQVTFSHKSPQGTASSLVPITAATLYLVNGYTVKPNREIVASPLPWMKDDEFSESAKSIIAARKGADFEIGRGLQVAPGYVDYGIDAALITIAQELATLAVPQQYGRIFVHSYKRANTLAYQRRVRSLKVVAVDKNNPENVILMTTAAEVFANEKPWQFSSAIKKLREINPQKISINTAWSFMLMTRQLARIELDYMNSRKELAEQPIIMRTNGTLYNYLIQHVMYNLIGLNENETQPIGELLDQDGHRLEDSSSRDTYADQLAAEPTQLLKSDESKAVVSLSNLDPKESKLDSEYEVRAIFGAFFALRAYMTELDVDQISERIAHVQFDVSTSLPEIKERLEQLAPTSTERKAWESRWIPQNKDQAGVGLTLTQTTANTYRFTSLDMMRLAQKYPAAWDAAHAREILRAGYFQDIAVTKRPTGL